MIRYLCSWFLASGLSLCPTASKPTPLILGVFTGEAGRLFDQDREQCGVQPLTVFCNPPPYSVTKTEDIMGTVRKAEAVARAHYTYKLDAPTDNWRTMKEAVLAGKDWTGDCDDLASTTIDVAISMGVPADHVYRALVLSPSANPDTMMFDHMVAFVRDEHGQMWVFGDATRHRLNVSVYPLNQMLHDVVFVSPVKQGNVWYRAQIVEENPGE